MTSHPASLAKKGAIGLCAATLAAASAAAADSMEALRRAAVSTSLSQDILAARMPEVPILIATADHLLKQGAGDDEVRRWLSDTQVLAERARQQLQLYELDRVALLSDSTTLLAAITQQKSLTHASELIEVARQLGGVRISSSELCQVLRCDARALMQDPQLAEQARAVAQRLQDSEALRRIAVDYFQKNNLSGLVNLTQGVAKADHVLARMAENPYVHQLLDGLPRDASMVQELPKRFTSVLESYAADASSVVESYAQRVRRIDDVEASLQFAGHLAGLIDPKVGSTVNQIGQAWTQLERARNAFNAAGNVANAFAMANSYMFAANVGISLLSGGSPLGGGGNEQAMMDAMRGYFEAVFGALQKMTEYMEKRFDQVDKRLTDISKQLSGIQTQLVSIEYKIDRVAATANVIRADVQEVHRRIDALESLIVGAAKLVVTFNYLTGKETCFRELGSGEAGAPGCLSLLKTYGVDHANGVFLLNSQTEGGRASSFETFMRAGAGATLAAALNEPGYDLDTLVEGGAAYTDYVAVLLPTLGIESVPVRQQIVNDLQAFRAALLSRQLVFRSFLWEPIAAVRITEPAQPPASGATVTFRRHVPWDPFYKRLQATLSVNRLVEAYLETADEIANARPDPYKDAHSNIETFLTDYETGAVIAIDQPLYQFCQKDDKGELEPVNRQYRRELRETFLSKYAALLDAKAYQIRVVRDVLLDGHAELLLNLSKDALERLHEFVYEPTTRQGLALGIERFVDEIGCQSLGNNEDFESRLSEFMFQLSSMAAIEPSAINTLEFRDRRIGPLIRRIDSIRAYIDLSETGRSSN